MDVLLNLVFELIFLNVFMGRKDSIELGIWFIFVYVFDFVILSVFKVWLG
jgi:hypothetical protein